MQFLLILERKIKILDFEFVPLLIYLNLVFEVISQLSPRSICKSALHFEDPTYTTKFFVNTVNPNSTKLQFQSAFSCPSKNPKHFPVLNTLLSYHKQKFLTPTESVKSICDRKRKISHLLKHITNNNNCN